MGNLYGGSIFDLIEQVDKSFKNEIGLSTFLMTLQHFLSGLCVNNIKMSYTH